VTDTQRDDPGDTPFHLLQNGWFALDIDGSHSEFYFKTLSVDDTAVDVIIEITPGGRRRFYVEDPPESLRDAAHNGDCLTNRGVASDVDGLYKIHFSSRPESLADGVRSVKALLEHS
jgi:hypothetical protein